MPIQGNMKHQSLMPHPYVIIRKGPEESWSEPTQIPIPADHRSMRRAEAALRAPERVKDRFDVSTMVLQVDSLHTIRIPILQGRTEVRLCMPSGVVFAAWNA